MTSKAIIELFTKHNGENFIIKTNEATGRGINGIAYTVYAGCFNYRENHTECVIKDVTDEYLVIRRKTNTEYPEGETEHIVPLDSITSIIFIKDANNYPDKIAKNPLFKKVK